MIWHSALGITPFGIKRRLKALIDNDEIVFAGNRKLNIYGRLDCRWGKRMKAQNRVFFSSENEATQLGYRPCARCMKVEYLIWRKSI